MARWHGMPLEVVDGLFGLVDHTWIEVALPGRIAILDIYSVGRLPMVQLVHHSFSTKMPYVGRPPRSDVRTDVIARLRGQWNRHLDDLTSQSGSVFDDLMKRGRAASGSGPTS